MSKKFGITCMVLGTLLMLSAGSLVLYNQYLEEYAKEQVEEQCDILFTRMSEEVDSEFDFANEDMSEMETIHINGYDYVGYLEIPDLDLSLPVQSEWSESGAKIAPCKYRGTVQSDSMIIAAHNYRAHFLGLKDLLGGEEVRFVDVKGTVWIYKVTSIQLISGFDTEQMLGGEWDLTLFTCNYLNRAQRLTVRCERTGIEQQKMPLRIDQ